MPTITKLKKRKLGIFEQFFWTSDQDAQFNICLSFRLKERFSIDRIKSAFLKIQESHFVLRSKVLEENGELYLQEISAPNLHLEIKQRKNSYHWKLEANKEVHTPFSCENPPYFRILILDSDEHQDIILTSHHLVADGKALLIILRELLEILLFKKTSFNPDVLSYSSIEDFISEESKKTPIGPSSLIHKSQRVHTKTSSESTGTLFTTLNRKSTGKLINFCKNNKLTIHSTLLASFIEEINSRSTKRSHSQKIKWETPVDLRRFLPKNISSNILGSNIAILSFLSNISKKNNFCSLAQDIMNKIHKQINPQLPTKALAAYKSANPFCKNSSMKIERKWTGPFLAFSNLGNLDKFFGILGEQIESIETMGALHGNFHTPESFHVICHTFKNRLHISFHFPSDLVSKQQAQEKFKRALDILENNIYS